jgi:hypothetical protein
LSWRVAILPYLGENALYKQFRLNEAWDSPHNKKLLKKMPRVYAPPGVVTRNPHSTFYQVFVGPHAAFEKHRVMQFPASFPDGTSNTILIVEAGHAVPWTKPADLPFAQDEPLPELGGLFREVFHAAFADGRVHALRAKYHAATLRKAIMRDDGDSFDLARLKTPTSRVLDRFVEQNERLQDNLQRERKGLAALRAEKKFLQEAAKNPVARAIKKENARLEEQLRKARTETRRLRQQIERLKKEDRAPDQEEE